MILAAVVATAVPAVSAFHTGTYDLVGEDPADDFGYTLAGQDDPSGLFGEAKVDILGLEFGTGSDELAVRLSLGASYHGTGGHMYTVWFDYAGSSYFTCWNIQTAGTTSMSEDVVENVFGCSLFNSVDATQVGPATRGDGVVVDMEDEHAFVEWPVDRSAVGDPADGDVLTNVYAETYARTGNPGAAGSTTHQEYQWHKQDVAPNEGVWEYVVGGAADEAASAVTFTVPESNATAAPGSWLVFEATASIDGNLTDNATANASFEATGPDGWDADLAAGGNATFNQTENETVVEVHVGIPQTAENGTYNVTLSALGDGNVTSTLNLTIVVDASLDPVDERPAAMGSGMHDDAGNETAGNGTAQDADEDALIPAPGPFFVASVLLAGAVWARRRRETL